MADQRDWDPEIDGAAANEGAALKESFRAKRTNTPRGVTMGDVKKDKSYRDGFDRLSAWNIIDGKVVK
jgi:hypothetical protein